MSQNYDYILDINLAQLPNFESMNSFFNNRSYTINPSGNSVDIQVNQEIVTSVLSYDYQKNIQNGVINYLPGNSSVTGNPDYATLSPVPSKFGYRMLEIIATKIFGNATDLIFVENGYSLYTLSSDSIITQIGDNIQNNFNNNEIQNSILNIYANSPDFISEPGTHEFNFKNSVWQFPLYYLDTIKFDNGNLGSNFNGPDAGGSRFVNGLINIPIRLKFYGPSASPGGVALVSLTALTYSGTGTWNDDSGNSKNATKETGTIAKNTAGNGIILDGFTSWSFSNVNAGTTWSASVWFKATGTPGITAQILTHNEGADINLCIGYTFYTTTDIAGAFFLAGYSAYVPTQPAYKIPNNVWTNFIYTRNGSNYNFYVNGVLYGTHTSATTITDSNAAYLIGRSWDNYSPNNFVVGEIGEVIIYNKALNQSEITNHYNQTVSIYNSFNPSTISGCQVWLDGADKSSMALTGSTVTTWNDKSGNSNNATAVGAPTFAPLTGITFNGGSDAFTLPNGSLPFNDSSYDYFLVINPTTIASGYQIITGGTGNDHNSYITLFNNAYGTPHVCRQDWNYNAIDSAIPLTVTQNNLVEMSYVSGANWTFNMNFQSTTGSPGATRTQNNQGNSIGGVTTGNFYPGSISEVIVYNTQLTTYQRQVVEGYLAWKWGFQSLIPNNHPFYRTPPLQNPFQLVSFNATTYSGTGAWNDDSGNRRNAIVENGVAAKNQVGNGIVLNGSTNWKFDAIGSQSKWSILTWFKRTAPSQQLACLLIQSAGSPQNMFLLSNGTFNSTNFSDEQFIGGFQDDVSNKGNYAQTFPLNEWHQMVVTWDGTNLKSYFDNAIQDTANYAGSISSGNKFYRIGSRWDAATFVTGELGELSLYGYAILNSEIASNYYSSIYKYIYFNPTSISGCQLWLDAFDPTTITLNGVPNVTSWKDKSGVGNDGTGTGSITYSSNTITTNGGKFATAYTANPTTETMFVVCSLDATGEGSLILDSSTIITGRTLGIGNQVMNIADGTNVILDGTTTVSTNTTLLYGYTLSATTNSSYYNASLDNSYAGSTFTGTNQTVIQPKTIKEIIFYNRVLSTYERQVVEGYLAWKWNIENVLPSTHPFYSTNPSPAPFKPLVLLKASTYSGTGSWLDESGYGRNATLENGTRAKNSAGNGIVLDGSTSWTFPNVAVGNAWTIGAWFKNTGAPIGADGGEDACIVTQISVGYDFNAFLGYMHSIAAGTTGYPYLQGAFSSTGGTVHVGTSYTVVNDVWTHYTVTWDGTTMTTYINGSSIGDTTPGGTAVDVGTDYRIGRRWDSADYVIGEIGEVRIYNYPLTLSQVLSDYQSSLSIFYSGPLVSLTASTYSGSGPWNDDTGNGFNASLETGTIAKNSAGNGIIFDGSTNWGFNSIGSYTNWSIVLWFKRTGASGSGGSIVNNGKIGIYSSSFFGIPDDSFAGMFYDTNLRLGAPQTFSTGIWTHMVVTLDGKNLLTYINGSLVNTTDFTGNTFSPGPNKYVIGRVYGGGSAYIQGELGQLKIYKRAISNTEVLNSYNTTVSTYTGILISLTASTYSSSGTWYDDTGNGKNATKAGGTIAKNTDGNGIVLDGSTYWTFPNVSAGNAWTLGVWYKNTGTPTGPSSGQAACIVAQEVITQPVSNIVLGYEIDGNNPFPVLKGGFDNTNWYLGTNYTTTNNVWFYYTITWNGTTMTTYVNGASIGTTTPGGTAIVGGLQYRIGRRYDNANYVVGEIGQVQIYNRPLTGGEITSHYNATSTSYQ